ncbi:MAG: dihydroorotate dehydrogenase-like protein [Desulfotalea sp.]
MVDLSTSYLGLSLKSPVIVGSCGFTNRLSKIEEIAAAGAGAVVLKSLFEEQILAELKSQLDEYHADYPGAIDYVAQYAREDILEKYLTLITDAKAAVDIPIIASVNCISGNEWVEFAKRIEGAGADAIELNVALLPSDPKVSGAVAEKCYAETIDKVASIVKIPLCLKMANYSSGLANLLTELSWKKNFAGFVLFSRFFRPDINIEKIELGSAEIFSHPSEISESLRWIALLANRLEKDCVAGTGIHDAEALIKQLLAGATAGQVVSVIYKHGISSITELNTGLSKWMVKNGYTSLADFRGKLGYTNSENPAYFERTQFMKYYGGIS